MVDHITLPGLVRGYKYVSLVEMPPGGVDKIFIGYTRPTSIPLYSTPPKMSSPRKVTR